MTTTTKTIKSLRTELITPEEISVQRVYYDLSAAATAATTSSSLPSESESEENYPFRSNDDNDDRDHERELGGGEMPGVYTYTPGLYKTMHSPPLWTVRQ